jgi:hypothetical protein
MYKSSLPATLFVLSLFTFGVCDANEPRVNIPPKENFHLFLLTGQSNMSGRGRVTDSDKEVHPRILALSPDGTWKHAVDPIHYDRKSVGVGLARSFAIELVGQDENITVGLVPAACGASPIAVWTAGAYFEKTDSYPYDDAIARTRLAMQDGMLKGILWHQGESDAKRDTGQAYEDKLIELSAGFQADLGVGEVPFIVGQLGRFDGNPWTDATFRINQAQLDAVKKIPMAGFVSAQGLTSKKDNIHFNAESLREFGNRYALKYLQVADGKSETQVD